MSLLKLKAKVRLVSEEDMEVEELDLGIIAKSKEWVWRSLAVITDEVYKVMAYSPTRSIVQMYDGEKILVAESFDVLSERWERAIYEARLSEADWPDYNEGDGTLDTDGDS